MTRPIGCGQLVSFSGGEITHGGLPVIAGVRYILPVFLFISKKTSLDSLNDSIKSKKRDLTIPSQSECENGPCHSRSKKPKIDFDQKGESYSFSFHL